jgi:hypothetical protein
MPSVTSCTLLRNPESASWDGENRGTYTLRYRIETDGILGPKAMRAGAQTASPHAFPSYGSTYSYQGDTDADSYAMSFSIQSENEQQTKHIGTVTFQPPPDEDVTIFEPNPFLRSPTVWADQEVFTRIIESDYAGNAIVNKCNFQYDTTVEKEDARGVLVIEFNVATIGEVIQYQRFLRRAVNQTAWTILGQTIAPRNAIARAVVGSPPITQGAYTYYRLAFRFAFADIGYNWDEPILERGYKYFVKTGDDFVTIGDPPQKKLFPASDATNPGDRIDLVEPCLLTAEGTKLPDGEIGIFTDWRINREVDFNLLPFSG